MRNVNALLVWLVALALTTLLAACGSGAGGGDELGGASPPPTTPAAQGSATDGESLYDSYCARCHSLQPHDTVGSPELAGKGDIITVKLQNSHMGNTLNSTELADLIAFANQGQVEVPAPAGPGADPAPNPDPGSEPAPNPVPVDGKTVNYGN
jgi:mono/diheme cytochrome c family protein